MTRFDGAFLGYTQMTLELHPLKSLSCQTVTSPGVTFSIATDEPYFGGSADSLPPFASSPLH